MYSYSHRLSWPVSSNAVTRLIEAKRSARVPLIDLTVSNPTQVFANYPHLAIRSAYAKVVDFAYRPDPFGRYESRLAVVDYYGRHGILISPEQLILTASTSEAYSILFKLFCDPGDEILTPIPSYPLFEYLAALEAVRAVPYRLFYDCGWFIDFASLMEQISPRTRAIVVVNPNNPTGSHLRKSEAEALFKLARQHALPVISDEVFTDYSYVSDADRVATLIGHDSVLSFSLNGLSKSAGMPQMKLGWIAVNGPEPDRQAARQRLELILDSYLSVATPVQCALPDLMKIGEAVQQEIVSRSRQNLSLLNDLLTGGVARPLHAEGGWSAIIQLPNTLSEEMWVTRLVTEQQVIVHPGYFFDMPSEAYVVVSLITPLEDFGDGISRLRRLAAI